VTFSIFDIGNQQSQENAVLLENVKKYEEENAELLARFQSLKDEMKAKKIDSFEALAEQDKKVAKLLIELARLTQPIILEGNNIGVFGLTSTGKSTLLNAILGMNVAETGAGETTKEITPYPGTQFTLWDVPGRNDEIIYISMEYISFFKGLTRRLILIQSTVKENSSMMKLLDELNLQYDIVVNKFDRVDEDERQEFKDQIQREVEKLQLKTVNKVFYVSAKHPQMFSDWIEMINSLTN
jgi:small GTP-binding protein